MPTKISVQGNVIERLDMDGRNSACHAIKVDADHWADPETGELHEFQHGTKRTDSVAALRRTFKRVRALINTNCTDAKKVRWITLTYAENMTDVERLYRDYGSFWKRFKRRWPDSEYIIVVEPQGRGAWHVHMLAIWQTEAPFIPNVELRRCWGHGFVKVTSLDNIDNVGAYLSAYLGDAVVEEGENFTSEKKCRDGTTKRIKKGGRLHMYPVGMNIYRHSRGIKKPEEFWIEDSQDLEKANALLQTATETYAKDYEWTDDRGQKHAVRYTQYNIARKSTQKLGVQGTLSPVIAIENAAGG